MIGVILGSGLGSVVDRLQTSDITPLNRVLGEELEGRVPPLGHHRRMIKAKYKNRDLLILQGRLHYYEGFPIHLVVEPVRYLKTLGVTTLILTFACGSLKRRFKTKDFVVLSDHIHLQSTNPLRGTTQFVDCTEVYDRELRAKLLGSAKRLKLRAFPGVYASTDGPSYETPAEVRAFAKLGADVVGMSVTAEALVARSLGLRVAGLGWVSNMASGLVPKHKLSHQEVLDYGRQIETPFSKLLLSFIESI
ncbi:MAG: purine-nucleoside phosphorylase [Elusimicrobia bacterium]|nr:purine-nucleoside phosphorylase [Elusimicrobiota bacterium]